MIVFIVLLGIAIPWSIVKILEWKDRNKDRLLDKANKWLEEYRAKEDIEINKTLKNIFNKDE